MTIENERNEKKYRSGAGHNSRLKVEDARLYNFVAPKSRVLVAHPKNYDSLGFLVQNRAAELYVVDVSIDNLNDVNDAGGVFLQGDMNKIHAIIESKKFDMVVMGESFLMYNDVVGVLKRATELAPLCLVSLPNNATWRHRLRFLLEGTIADRDGVKWYRKGFVHSCNHREFVEMCVSNGMMIERGCFYDSSGAVHSMYSAIKAPSLFADRFYFIIRAL